MKNGKGSMRDAQLSEKIDAEIAKLIAETAKLNKETRWYDIVVIAGVVGALLATGKYLL